MLANAAEALTGFNAAIVRSSSTTVEESYSLPAFGSGWERGERILANGIGCLRRYPKTTGGSDENRGLLFLRAACATRL